MPTAESFFDNKKIKQLLGKNKSVQFELVEIIIIFLNIFKVCSVTCINSVLAMDLRFRFFYSISLLLREQTPLHR